MRVVVESAVPRFPEFRFSSEVNWCMEDGENWAVIGPNGAGKTLFTDLIQGKIALRTGSATCIDENGEFVFGVIKSVAFRDIHSLTDSKNMYYQQRWNSQDAEEAPLASSLLNKYSQEKIEEYTKLFDIYNLLDRRVISLSSGELRKFLITRILMSEPKVLILDNPFIGLDAASRESLNEMLKQLYAKRGLQTILVLSHPKDLPTWVSNVQPIKGMRLLPTLSRDEFMGNEELLNELFPEHYSDDIEIPYAPNEELPYSQVVDMSDVRVKYAGTEILSGINWSVKKGEKWALLGENGSGKSTLLSLVCGDNPQAYANNMSLFGRRRGTGESIWEIKKRIGYLTPDMHTYYLEDIPCLKVVSSGFFDSVGLFKKCTEEQINIAKAWMKVFNAEYLEDSSFVKISYGEQRLVLLIRAFVKNPELLILDEPLHGLDAGKKRLAKSVIEKFCNNPEKTLIYVSHYKEEIPACVTESLTLKKRRVQ